MEIRTSFRAHNLVQLTDLTDDTLCGSAMNNDMSYSEGATNHKSTYRKRKEIPGFTCKLCILEIVYNNGGQCRSHLLLTEEFMLAFGLWGKIEIVK